MKRLMLVKPSKEYIDEIRAYRQEFIDNGGHFNGDSGLRKFEDISAWIEQCRLMEHKKTVLNPEWVEADQFILVRDGERRVLGMINFRHYLNEYLAEYAGHIGYGVRPTERRKGYAKAMLTICLKKCREHGLEKVLITCDEDNEASRRTILACGGKFESSWTSKRTGNKPERYWITLCDKSKDSVINHYDSIIDKIDDPQNYKVVDPANDPEPLRAYMDKWDGKAFIEAMQLNSSKSVLEIGVGTGRLALRVCGKCGSYTGIDISPKTAERATENLQSFPNVNLICSDYLTHHFDKTFDVIYSSLTFMHIKEKQAAIQKTLDLLTPGGRFVLSIDKNQQTEIDYGTRRIPVFPDTPKEIGELLTKAGFIIEQQFETEFAVIFAVVKKVAFITRSFKCRKDCCNMNNHETAKERQARIYPIILSEYNPAWAEWFIGEKANLERLIGMENIVRISHFGSTSVPGLTAKPTVDILLEIKEDANVSKLIDALSSPEYICLNPPDMPTPPPHLMFLKGYTPTGFAEKVYHIHVRYPDHWDELYFRDYLIAHPEIATEYAALKAKLHKSFEHDRAGYTKAKTAFIHEVTEKARKL